MFSEMVWNIRNHPSLNLIFTDNQSNRLLLGILPRYLFKEQTEGMARKTWSQIIKEDIVGNDFYVDWECAGNSIQFTTTDFFTFGM